MTIKIRNVIARRSETTTKQSLILRLLNKKTALFNWTVFIQPLLNNKFLTDGFQALGANSQFLAGDSPGLQIDILPFKSFNIRMGAAGALSGTAAAQIAFFRHIGNLRS